MNDAEPIRASLASTLDQILRNRSQQAAAAPVTAGTLVRLGLLLGVLYGVALGGYGLLHGGDQAWRQLASSAMKIPLLFLLTLLVTFPSLYVFSALHRLPFGVPAMLRLLLVAIVVHLAVAASLGPVFLFFAACTDSYGFLLLLNVAFFAIGGWCGVSVLTRQAPAATTRPAVPTTPDGPPPVPVAASHRVLLAWVVIYCVVGAQMSWLLRPFLGAPGHAFELFRERESNFFAAVITTLRSLFHG